MGINIACGYLWHIFSYEKKKCLEGEEAENTFHNEMKNGLLYILSTL